MSESKPRLFRTRSFSMDDKMFGEFNEDAKIYGGGSSFIRALYLNYKSEMKSDITSCYIDEVSKNLEGMLNKIKITSFRRYNHFYLNKGSDQYRIIFKPICMILKAGKNSKNIIIPISYSSVPENDALYLTQAIMLKLGN